MKLTELVFFLFVIVMTGVFLTPWAWSEDWQVMWKDSTTTLQVDRDSVRANGQMVEYWYSDQLDALVDWMEHHFYAVSDCEHNRLKLVQMHDPATGQTKELEPKWKDMSYDPDDPVTVMHEEICRQYSVH